MQFSKFRSENGSIAVDGHWWTPEEPDKKVAGRLSFNAKERIQLECFEVLLSNSLERQLSKWIPREHRLASFIHGELLTGEEITLLSVFSLGEPPGQPSREAIGVNAIAEGSLLTEEFATQVKSTRFELDNLSSWLQVHPFEMDYNLPGFNEHSPPCCKYVLSGEPQIVGQVELIDASVEILHDLKSREGLFSVEFNHYDSIRITFSKAMRLDAVEKTIGDIQLLFTLLTGVPSYVQQRDFETPCGKQFAMHRPTWARSSSPYAPKRMPCVFRDLPTEFHVFLNEWFVLCQTFQSVCALLAASLWGAGTFVEDRFLTLAQAIEALADLSCKDLKYCEKAEFQAVRQKMAECIPEDAPEKFKEVASSRLGFLNTFSLRDKILRLFENRAWLSSLLPSGDPGEFARLVSDARNRLTHPSSNQGRNESSSQETSVETIRELRRIISAVLLCEIGVSPDNFQVDEWKLRKWW